MHYWVTSFTAVLFCIWLLPLGIFIKPAQEKMACDGQRAVCMCSHIKSETKSTPIEGHALKANTGVNKESTAGGAGHYYLAAHLPIQNGLSLRALNDVAFLSYRNPFSGAIEHVPKV